MRSIEDHHHQDLQRVLAKTSVGPSRAGGSSWLARGSKRGAVEELEWLLNVAGELTGSAQITVTVGRGSLATGAQMVLAGIECGGIGNDAGSALGDMCEGLERWLLDAVKRGQRTA